MTWDFVAIDFETTGLSPRVDRIIEVGIVRTSTSGEILERYSSLVNPMRDVGKTSIHGITPGMLKDAPRFEEIVDDIANIMNDAVLVAHNASFDARFLDFELERINHDRKDIDGICTMEMMSRYFPGAARRLVDCCVHFGIPILNSHCALDDAQMTSDLLHVLRDRCDDLVLPDAISIARRFEIRRDPVTRETVKKIDSNVSDSLRNIQRGESDQHNQLIPLSANQCQYLNILDEALEDRRLTLTEVQGLFDFASLVRLSESQVSDLHEIYIASIYAKAMEDHLLTLEEKSDLDLVAELLGVTDWKTKVGTAASLATDETLFRRTEIEIRGGMSVCFSGEMIRSRGELEEIARSHGLLVKSGVSRNLDILVLADADSMSSKARKARELEVPVISEQLFLQLLTK